MKHLAILSLIVLQSTLSPKAQVLKNDSMTDINGNAYRTVVIGKYEWMADNLKTTTYSDGTKIPNVTDSILWTGLTIGAYCWYNNNENNANTYGALYNWHAVGTGRLCPNGWRVPSDEEWKYLEGAADSRYGSGDPIWDKFAGRGFDAGQRLKTKSGWSFGGSGTDDFGFSALPGGERCSYGRFFIMGKSGFWWSRTENDSTSAWYRNIIYGVEDVNRLIHPKWMGFSVRCLREKK